MSTGAHTGKLVIEIPKGLTGVQVRAPSTVFRSDATYVITGMPQTQSVSNLKLENLTMSLRW
jgi:hypothetical protein